MLPNLQNYDSHLIFQELGDCNSKRHVISKLIEIYMTFAMEQRRMMPLILDSIFLYGVHFLNDWLENIAKILGKKDFSDKSR